MSSMSMSSSQSMSLSSICRLWNADIFYLESASASNSNEINNCHSFPFPQHDATGCDATIVVGSIHHSVHQVCTQCVPNDTRT